jgi:gamma-D-glutamyl-L-lysine dipeptidyl-peptidase
MRLLVSLAGALVLAAPAGATLTPGDNATVDVSVATLWKGPNLYRSLDRPSLGNPVDLDAWNRNLSTTASRAWLDSHVQTQALYGQEVVVLERSGGWAKVAVIDEPDPQDPHGYPGWLPASLLKSGFDSGGRYVVVTARTGPLLVNGRTLNVSYGTRLPLVKWAGDMAIVRTPDGTGTVSGVVEPMQPSAASIVGEAERFVGLRYLWGGLSAWGFDCSGLVWDVFRVHGMTVPRDADPQFHHGTAVARSQLRVGDLLFWGSKNYADHVAIYAGNGTMVEAPDSAHSVRVVPVRWDRFYLGARRYLAR